MTPVDGNIATGHPGRPLVLVVEDEENVAFVIAAALKLSGLEVAQARTGREALSLLGGGMTPDLVVLDVMLPDLDGFEVCRGSGPISATCPSPSSLLVTRLTTVCGG